MRTPVAPHDELTLVRTVRDGRFARGVVACPRCGCDHVVKWGGFSGRQRYRCRGCRRTFSDLTLTLFAYSKRLSHWPHYAEQFRRSTTLRRTAVETGLHLSTTFRWRHALLGALRRGEPMPLEGIVEYAELSFAHSDKGARDLEDPRPRGNRGRGWEWYATPRTDAALLYGRTGRVFGCALLPTRAIAVDRLLGSMLGQRCTIVSSDLPLGPMAGAARRAGHRHWSAASGGRYASDGVRHLENVKAYSARLRRWMLRFRGVATRYLDNYMVWHRAVDPELGMTWVMALLLGASRAPPGA